MATIDACMGINAPVASPPAGGAASSSSAAASAASSSSSAAPSSQFLTRIFSQLVQSTRLANALPDADDHKFHSGNSTEFAAASTGVQSRLLNMLGLLSDAVRHPHESALAHNTKGTASTAIAAAGSLPPSRTLSALPDSLDRFHAVVDVVDGALEQVDLLLDAQRGVKRGTTAIAQETSKDGRMKTQVRGYMHACGS